MTPSLSAQEIHRRFVQKELHATEIVEAFSTRIHTYEPKIRAFLHILAERAEQQAHKLDEKRDQGKPLGRLAGIPIAIKDNIHIEGEKTTCASRFLENYIAPFSATVVRLLENEGAILIGKTNLDEFAMGSSTENSTQHPTQNPWNTTCSPGGSSGGSAAAVAARFCPIALGSDTGGSVRQPASFCGVVGFKPTYGRVSRYGLVAYGSSLDQIGPITHNVADAGMVMEILGRHCDHDSTSLLAPPERYLTDQTCHLKGVKIGVPFSYLENLGEEEKNVFTHSLDILQEAGAHVQNISLPTLSSSLAMYYVIATAEASTNLARFDGIGFSRRSKRATTLQEIYEYSKEEGFGPEVKRRILLGTYVLSAGYRDAYYKQAQKARTKLIREFANAFLQYRLIALPSTPGTAFPIGSVAEPLQMYLQDVFSVIANLAGLPAVSVPAGFAKNGLPLGLQLIGPQKGDVRVLDAAYAFEQIAQLYKRAPELPL